MPSSDSRRSMLAWVLATSLIALHGATGSAHATVYKWVDSSGIAHYTTDPAEVPAALRSQIPEASSGEAVDMDRIPPPRGPAGANLLSAIPAPRLRRQEAPARAALPAPELREGASEPESSLGTGDALLRDIPPPRPPASGPLDLGAIPPPRSQRDGARGIAEPPPFAPEALAPEAARRAGPMPDSPATGSRGVDAVPSNPDSEGASGIGSVDSAPPFDSLFDEAPRAESPEILELERRIEADRDRLKKMLTTARSGDSLLSDDPELRAISQRLPLLQARLAALRAQRDR